MVEGRCRRSIPEISDASSYSSVCEQLQGQEIKHNPAKYREKDKLDQDEYDNLYMHELEPTRKVCNIYLQNNKLLPNRVSYRSTSTLHAPDA